MKSCSNWYQTDFSKKVRRLQLTVSYGASPKASTEVCASLLLLGVFSCINKFLREEEPGEIGSRL